MKFEEELVEKKKPTHIHNIRMRLPSDKLINKVHAVFCFLQCFQTKIASHVFNVQTNVLYAQCNASSLQEHSIISCFFLGGGGGGAQ